MPTITVHPPEMVTELSRKGLRYDARTALALASYLRRRGQRVCITMHESHKRQCFSVEGV